MANEYTSTPPELATPDVWSRTLVVAATEAEAAYVPVSMPLVITGIGKVAAASAVSWALATTPDIDLVVNIGSAGALRDGYEGVHQIGRVWNHDLSSSVLRTLGYDPQEWMDLSLPGVPNSLTALATGDTFVTDPEQRRLLAIEAHLVDMEGYAVAWAARQAGVPVRLVKHVSDNADEGSMDWPHLVDASARALGDWLRANIR